MDHCQAAQTPPVHRKQRRVWRMVVLATQTPPTDGPQPKATCVIICPAEELARASWIAPTLQGQRQSQILQST
jgi:hypothetical protein